VRVRKGAFHLAAATALLSPLLPAVTARSIGTMAVVTPTSGEDRKHSLFFWDAKRISESISMSEVGQSTLRLMGAPAVNADASRKLPSADVVTPPQGLLVLSMGSREAAAMPLLQKLLQGQTSVSVRDTENYGPAAVASVAERAQRGSTALGMQGGYTACISAISAVSDSTLCSSATDSIYWREHDNGFKTRGTRGIQAPPSEFPVELAGVSVSRRSDDGSWFVSAHGAAAVAFASESEKFVVSELLALCALPALASRRVDGVEKGGFGRTDVLLASLSGDLASLDEEGGDEEGEKKKAALALTDAVVHYVLTRLERSYDGALVAQVLLLDPLSEGAHRFLSETDDAAADAGALTVEQIATYQICLWTAVVLILALLGAICGMINMDVRPDSLLYAKFQADVSSKND